MSWDLLVAIHDSPLGVGMDEYLPASGYSAAGSLVEENSNVLVSRTGKSGERPAFTVDGPHKVEVEDIPEVLAYGVLSPRFLLEISVPAAGTQADRSLAKKVARQIAERFRGAVYDPQEDALVWPKTRRRTYSASSEEQRIRVVELAWYVRHDPSGPLAAQLLEGVRVACPEALPRRYGDYEPLQHKLEPGCEAEFVAFWQELAANDLGKMFFWKSQSPCFGGTVSFPDTRETFPDGRPVGIPGTQPCTKISLDFDGRALHADARWADAVIRLFTSLAKRLPAFYAVGCVARNVIAKRSLWYDSESESLPLPFSFFAGLAPVPTWLAWFGEPYAEHVVDWCRDNASQRAEGAWFFQGGPEPMDKDELEGRFSSLPPRLVFEERSEPQPGEPRIVAAEFVPQIYPAGPAG